MGNGTIFNSKCTHLFTHLLTLFPKEFERTSKGMEDLFFHINLEFSALIMKH